MSKLPTIKNAEQNPIVEVTLLKQSKIAGNMRHAKEQVKVHLGVAEWLAERGAVSAREVLEAAKAAGPKAEAALSNITRVNAEEAKTANKNKEVT